MSDEKFVFLDFDNTLCDQFQLNLQYVREVGNLLAPKYGGEAEDWAKAMADVMEAMEQDYIARFLRNPLNGYCAWLEEMRPKAATMLFTRMGLPLPPNIEQLAIETQFNALTACDATFPGAYDALNTLFEGGYRTQIASGQESEWLLAALMGAGIESFTESKFGPDLIDCAKEGPEFYERIFAQVGVAPAATLVIDNDPVALGWAMQVGAKAIQVKVSPEYHLPEAPGIVAAITDLSDLPRLVRQTLG
ncbi:MAG TPA: HAD family hydrolase [Chthonomonadaceae bacterium]|nr:HAD family hydrolase [Chthonomonadaceae bacterium]